MCYTSNNHQIGKQREKENPKKHRFWILKELCFWLKPNDTIQSKFIFVSIIKWAILTWFAALHIHRTCYFEFKVLNPNSKHAYDFLIGFFLLSCWKSFSDIDFVFVLSKMFVILLGRNNKCWNSKSIFMNRRYCKQINNGFFCLRWWNVNKMKIIVLKFIEFCV